MHILSELCEEKLAQIFRSFRSYHKALHMLKEWIRPHVRIEEKISGDLICVHLCLLNDLNEQLFAMINFEGTNDGVFLH